MASMDTTHPHRGFDNFWYAVSGSSSTGHSTGPRGAMERARLEAGSLLKLRTGRGILHAEGVGADELGEGKAGTEMRGCSLAATMTALPTSRWVGNQLISQDGVLPPIHPKLSRREVAESRPLGNARRRPEVTRRTPGGVQP